MADEFVKAHKNLKCSKIKNSQNYL